MSLEHFREPTTPESRMHRIVLVLLCIGAVRGVWGLFVQSAFSVEIAVGVTVAAIAYAVWRYVRQPGDRSAGRIPH
jgi:hypothetical protein